MYVINVITAATLLAFALAQHPPRLSAEDKAFSEECVKENNFDLEAFKTAHGELPDSKSFRCYLSCFMMKTGAMNSQGVLQKDAFLSKFSAHKNGADAFANCAEIKKDDPCDTAYEIHMCIHKIMKERHA